LPTGNIEKTITDLKITKDDLIICADGGYDIARQLNIVPDYIIGDLDSLIKNPDRLNIKIIKAPSMKDETDTVLCINHALSEKCSDIYILGGTGNRLDHTYAVLQTLKYISENGSKGYFINDSETVLYLKNNSIGIDGKCKYISVFSYSERSTGVDLKGFKYPLDNAELTNEFPLGISNELSNKGEISVKNGELLIFLIK